MCYRHLPAATARDTRKRFATGKSTQEIPGYNDKLLSDIKYE